MTRPPQSHTWTRASDLGLAAQTDSQLTSDPATTHTQAGGDRERWRQTNGRIMRSGDRQRCRDNPLHCSDICRALAGISITEIYWSYLYNVLLPSNKLPPLQNLLITIWCGCYHTSWYRNIPITTAAAQLSGRHLLSEWRGWHGTGPHSSSF